MKGGNMKYLLFIFLLATVLITAGCTSGNGNVAVAPTQTTTQILPVTTSIPIQTTALPTSVITPTPKDITVERNPYAVSVRTANEQEACAQGRITDLEYCAKIGVTFDKNGNYRINISKMNF